MALEKVMNESLGKIAEFLLENPVLDYSKEEIAEQSGVSRSTVYRKWEKIEQLGLVKETRKYQNTQLYRLNKDADIVNTLGRMKRELEEIERERDREPVSA